MHANPEHPDFIADTTEAAAVAADLSAIVSADPDLVAFSRTSTVALASNDAPPPESEDAPGGDVVVLEREKGSRRAVITHPAPGDDSILLVADSDGDTLRLREVSHDEEGSGVLVSVNGAQVLLQHPDDLRVVAQWLLRRAAKFRGMDGAA